MENPSLFENARTLFLKLYHLQRDSDAFEWAQANELRAMLADFSFSDVFRLLDEMETIPSVSDSDVYES